MISNLKLFLRYREQNKLVSKSLGIRRDRIIELYFLFGFWKIKKIESTLKKKCKCYLTYYENKNKIVSFKNLDYIVSRIVATYNILGDEEILNEELSVFDDNIFFKTYIKRRISELIKSDKTETSLRATI